MKIDPGFNSENVLTLSVSLPDKKYPKQETQAAFYQQSLDNLRALPGVRMAAVTTTVPFSGNDMIFSIEVDGRPPAASGQNPSANWYSVSPATSRRWVFRW
jgi:hypothetical protein